MFKVKFEAATSETRLLIDEADLNFDPRLSPTIRMRRKVDSVKHTDYQVMPDQGVAEIVDGDPDQNRIIVYLKELKG